MNRQETQPNSASRDRMLEVSAAQKVQTIAGQFAARGVAKAVAEQTNQQIAKEKETRKIAPTAYRLSSMSDAVVSGCYRHGKENMSGADLVRYFNETRAIRTKEEDFSLALSAKPDVIFDLSPDILTLKEKVERAHENKKKLFTKMVLAQHQNNKIICINCMAEN